MELPYEQRMAKALLGSQYRALIAAALHAAEEPVSAQEIADETGIRYPRVQQEMKHLLGAQLLRLVASPGRAVLYDKVDSGYWRMCAQLLEEWRSTVPRRRRVRSH